MSWPTAAPAPQEEIHLELLRALLDDAALNVAFPGLVQGAPKTLAAHSRVAQSRHADNLHDACCPFVQPHDLLAPLVKLLQRLLSCIFFFHLSSIEKIQ